MATPIQSLLEKETYNFYKMKNTAKYFAITATLSACYIPIASSQTSQWVQQGATGLIYQMDSRGDRILNYTAAGYRGGVEIPSAASLVAPSRVVNVTPIGGDNRARIQSAINQVKNMPLNANGYRGIVQLSAGQFNISSGLVIDASGVILRGAGDGANASANTILRSTSTNKIDIIEVANTQFYANNLSRVGSPANITNKVVPSGATSFQVANTSGFSVGDWINVKHTPRQAWFDAMGVTHPSWSTSATRFTTQQERRITRIEGDRVLVHAPLSQSIDQRLANGTIEKYNDGRIDHVGIENIRGTSVFNRSETGVVQGRPVFTDEDHAENFIHLTHAENSWVRNITSQHMSSSAVSVGTISRSITVQDSTYIDAVSQVTGGRRYAFNVGGSQVLMKDLTSDSARRAFINNSTYNGFNRGPNVFLNSKATNSFSRSGPHANYSTGSLYDNISDDFGIEARFSTSSSPHGWRGGHIVIWNTGAADLQVSDTPISRNYLIGSSGGFSASNGTVDSYGQRISFNDPENPLESLYVQQKLEQQRNPDIQQREYWLGDFDQFEADGPSSDDDVYIDPDWLAAVNNMGGWRGDQPIADFDDNSANRRVPFSFKYDLADDEYVFSAVLTLATKRLGSHSDSEPIFIDGLTGNHVMNLSAGDWGVTYEDGLQILTLEFIGADFLQDGLLNILLSDDRPADWAHLLVNVGPAPEPGTLSAIAISSLLLGQRRRRK